MFIETEKGDDLWLCFAINYTLKNRPAYTRFFAFKNRPPHLWDLYSLFWKQGQPFEIGRFSFAQEGSIFKQVDVRAVGQSHHTRVSSQMIEAGNSTLTSWYSVFLSLFFLLLEFVVIGYFFLHYQVNDAGNLVGIFVDFRDFFDCGSETFLVALLFMVQDKFLPKHH